MDIRVNFRSGEAIYIQIMEQIRQMVAAGELKPGDQLPTVRQLATELRVNFNTVARAYRLLDEAGLISTQQGRGTYIWEQPDESTLERLDGLNGLTRRYLAEAGQMGYSPAEVRETLQRLLQAWEAEGAPRNGNE